MTEPLHSEEIPNEIGLCRGEDGRLVVWQNDIHDQDQIVARYIEINHADLLMRKKLRQYASRLFRTVMDVLD